MTADAGPRGDGRSLAVGIAVTAAFAISVVGSNIPGPILPLYEDDLGLGPFALSVLFATYFVALIAMFLVSGATRLGRYSWAVLPSALVLGVLGDVALWSGADFAPLLFVGRALTGACVGLATGAAATLAVAARGDAGRTLAATGAIGGSLIGLVSGAVVGEFLPAPTVLIYQLHAGALGFAGVALAITLWRWRTGLSALLELSAPAGVATTERNGRPGPRGAAGGRGRMTRRSLAAYGLGAVAWTVGGIAVGVLPASLREGLDSEVLVVGALAAIVLLTAASLGPHVGRLVGRVPTPAQSLALLGVGALSVSAGLLASSLWPILLGSLAWGVAQGFAFADGLRMLTAGLAPVRQGRSTSIYACTSYGAAAMAILAAGALSTIWGYVVGTAVVVGAYAGICVVVAVIGRGRWDPTAGRRSFVST